MTDLLELIFCNWLNWHTFFRDHNPGLGWLDKCRRCRRYRHEVER